MSQYAQQVNKYLLSFQQDKQKEQFDELYNFTAGHMIVIALMYLNDKSLVSDVISESFIRVFTHIQSFDSSKDGYNWMCRIVQNVASDYNKKEKREYDVKRELVREYRDNEYTMDLSELEFNDLIEFLDETEQLILRQRYIEDKSLESIAQSLNVTKSAISLRIKRMRKKFKKR